MFKIYFIFKVIYLKMNFGINQNHEDATTTNVLQYSSRLRKSASPEYTDLRWQRSCHIFSASDD
jgi:hypothetical protein